MTLPSFGNIARQIGSGYTPPGYWLYPLLVLVTLALAALVAVELARWMRGSRRALVGVDLAVLAASWTVLVIYAFSNDLPIVTAVLSPVALLLAWKAPRLASAPRRRAFGTTGASSPLGHRAYGECHSNDTARR